MRCKNCGEVVPKNSSICTNCGSVVDKKSDYVLLTNEVNVTKSQPQNLKQAKKKKQVNTTLAVIISCIFIIAAGIGSYFFFIDQNANRPQPELEFTSGYGVINGDEQVIYVTIKDSSKIEYIHGVKLYDSQIDGKSLDGNVVSTDYKYTKNIDNSFRTIYFDMDDLNLDPSQNYTYSFQMSFSFYEDENVYNYYNTLNFVGSTQNNIAEIVFDHTKKDTNKVDLEEETAVAQDNQNADKSFIYSTYWFTKPYKTDTYWSISSFGFNQDNTYSVTKYERATDGFWQVSSSNGTFEINKNTIILKDENGIEESSFEFDANAKSIYEIAGDAQAKNELTSRKYNTVQNAENLFK